MEVLSFYVQITEFVIKLERNQLFYNSLPVSIMENESELILISNQTWKLKFTTNFELCCLHLDSSILGITCIDSPYYIIIDIMGRLCILKEIGINTVCKVFRVGSCPRRIIWDPSSEKLIVACLDSSENTPNFLLAYNLE